MAKSSPERKKAGTVTESIDDRLKLIQAEDRPEVMVEAYTKWADTYEEDIAKYYGNLPLRSMVEGTASVLGDHKDAKILDCAAGTGLVGKYLAERGYTNIDAIDACEAMLEKAKEKNVYQRIICDFLGTNKLDIDDDTYDAVVINGGLAPNHIGSDCFGELVRITKAGGYIMFRTQEHYLSTSLGTLEKDMQDLVDQGIWVCLKRETYNSPETNQVFLCFQVV